ncbi:DUF6113 family protein [Actinomadura macrotermitis]|uniref:Integral membrane protein n=1 Tax=Actinomadura macrotermitis TaxID=2585200 RepID=A0A7K0BT04_9ACTN|nr:DUF6113 family protein [Actinomadura macrotermitis]MQY03814.1 hypothetical protein [Actinomadura macrotermitis]
MDKDGEAPPAPEADDPPGLTAAGTAPAGEGPVEAFVTGAAYAALALLGGVVGVLGSFAQDWQPAGLPVASVALIVLNLALVWLAGRGMGGRLGAVIPAAAWMAVVFVMSTKRAEGDLVVPGTTAGYVFIVGGMVAAVAGAALVPSRRPAGEWLTRGLTAGGGRTGG